MKFISTVIVLFILSFNLYSSSIPFDRGSYVSDRRLRNKAIEEGVLPESKFEFDLKKHIKEQNTLIIWLVSPRQYKIDLINHLKEINFKKEGITINNPSAYYVDQINGVIYNALKNDDIEGYNKKGVGTIFQTIAIQEGDYDTNDGKNAIEIMRDYWGEEEFEWYKKTYPKKFEALIEIDKKKNK